MIKKYTWTVKKLGKMHFYRLWKKISVQIIYITLFQMHIHNMKLTNFY